MVKCAIKTCGLRKDNYNHGLTLHRLPRNETEKKKWIEVIGADNINLNIKNTFICSMHFEESSFNRTLDVIRLRDNSVPSLYLQSPAPVQEYLPPVLRDPANKLMQAGVSQRSCEQIKVTSGPSPKFNGKSIFSPSEEIKLKDHYLSESDPLGELPVPLSDPLDPLGEAKVTSQVPPEYKQARFKDDTYLTCMQTSKINALNIRCKTLNKKLKRYRELLRRRERKMADLQTDVDSLRTIITEHDRSAGGGASGAGGGGGEDDAPTIQVLSSKDGVVKKKSSRQVLYIKRGVTRRQPQAGGPRSPDLLQKSAFSVVRTTDIRAQSPGGGLRTSVIRQKPPAAVIRTSVIRKTLSDIRQKSSDILQQSLVGALPTLDIQQKLVVDVQRTSDIPPNALVIQIDGKHSTVLQPTLVRLDHTTHMETG